MTDSVGDPRSIQVKAIREKWERGLDALNGKDAWWLLREVEDLEAELTRERSAREAAESKAINVAITASQQVAMLQDRHRAVEAALREQREAFDRVVEYIRTAMKPISIKEACGETAYDRAERRGLQHGLNSVIAEFAKAGTEYPAALSGDAAPTTKKEL